jgi:2'-5' RNA ligase
VPLPTQMADHWWQRPGRSPGRIQYHWHVLFHDQPAVRELAARAQRKLQGLPGLSLVPRQWLHLTTLIVGFADEVTAQQLEVMTADASRRLAGIAPVPVRLGRIYYDPEAIVLPVDPLDALTPVHDAVRAATLAAGCHGRTDSEVWLPHVSVAYSHACGPAGSFIDALGRRLPEIAISIRSVSLVGQTQVGQTQVGRSWQWQPVAEIPFAGSSAPPAT